MCANLFDAAETATKTHTNVRADVEGVDQTSAGRQELRARVIAKPGNFKVHTSHFAADDLEKRKGNLCPKPGALPVPISHAERWLVEMVASGLLKHLAQQDPVLHLLRPRQLLDLVHH